MGNYPYIIASLPEIALTFDHGDFSYSAVRDHIYESCSQRDKRLIEWMDFGFNESNLNDHFYRASSKCHNNFIKEYFSFDKKIRLEKVAYLQKETTTTEFEEKEALYKAFEISNIIEREKQLDQLKWNKICSLTHYGDFNVDVVLAFIAKAYLIERWNRLDKATGEELFRKFVDEVNATYKESKNR
ncbi:MAG: DUF2764 family protein [Bacteroidales bacterium]|nr:DUF2764 family protein [Bacteroidales bacterium]